MFERETDQIVGAACVQYLGRDPANPHELGWRLRADRWGKGYASEAARHMARFAFDQLNAPLVCAVCQPGNRASAHVMEKLGMTYKGEETWYDMTCSRYDITRDEWLTRAAAQPR